MVTVSCEVCGKEFEAKRRTRRYCGDRCNKRAQRGTKLAQLPGSDVLVMDLVGAVRTELTELGVQGSPAGQQAIGMAVRMMQATKDTGSSYAAISRELSRLLDEAKAGATRKADPLDELRDRRERKRASA